MGLGSDGFFWVGQLSACIINRESFFFCIREEMLILWPNILVKTQLGVLLSKVLFNFFHLISISTFQQENLD